MVMKDFVNFRLSDLVNVQNNVRLNVYLIAQLNFQLNVYLYGHDDAKARSNTRSNTPYFSFHSLAPIL